MRVLLAVYWFNRVLKGPGFAAAVTQVPMITICISAGLRWPCNRPVGAGGAGAGEGVTTGEGEKIDCSIVGGLMKEDGVASGA